MCARAARVARTRRRTNRRSSRRTCRSQSRCRRRQPHPRHGRKKTRLVAIPPTRRRCASRARGPPRVCHVPRKSSCGDSGTPSMAVHHSPHRQRHQRHAWPRGCTHHRPRRGETPTRPRTLPFTSMQAGRRPSRPRAGCGAKRIPRRPLVVGSARATRTESHRSPRRQGRASTRRFGCRGSRHKRG